MNRRNFMTAMGAVAAIVASPKSSPVLAKGDVIASPEPYVVGSQAPEVIEPNSIQLLAIGWQHTSHNIARAKPVLTGADLDAFQITLDLRAINTQRNMSAYIIVRNPSDEWTREMARKFNAREPFTLHWPDALPPTSSNGNVTLDGQKIHDIGLRAEYELVETTSIFHDTYRTFRPKAI